MLARTISKYPTSGASLPGHKYLMFAISLFVLALLVFGRQAPASARGSADEGITSGEVPLEGVYTLSLPLLMNGFGTPVSSLPDRSLICVSPGAAIPDSNARGIDLTLLNLDRRPIADLDVFLDVSHTHTGDLVVSLTHVSTGHTARLVDRPGYPETDLGCSGNDINAILDDEMALTADSRCGDNGTDLAGRVIPAMTGSYIPATPLDVFDGESAAGVWTLTVADLDDEDLGTVNKWCLAPVYGDPQPITPRPASLPDSARIYNISGVHQSMPLSCEIRSAVDFANYFGTPLSEFEFFNLLPSSDNPDYGFVGDVWGTWGQIPPYAYGVHAEPIAKQLRAYGVTAYAHRPLSWDGLRYEIANSRPVIVWVVDGMRFVSPPVYWTSSDGHISQVSRYEHSVMVIGYTDTSVTILDGDKIYTRGLDAFLSAWSVMGNMAVTATSG